MSRRLNSCLPTHTSATAHLPGPQNPGMCHLYFAEGCHLYIALTVGQRITLPTPPADLFVVMGVAVGADVEPRHLLRAQMRRYRILVLLAPARIDHRLEEAAAGELN